MEYFVSHLPVIFVAALIVAGSAVLYWYSLERSARAKRQRAEALRAAAMKKKEEQQKNTDIPE